MPSWRQRITWRLDEGLSVTRDGTTITPLTRVFAVRWPGGGLLRAWPAGLIIQHGGTRRRVLILDATRLLRLGILALGSWWLLTRSLRQRSKHHA